VKTRVRCFRGSYETKHVGYIDTFTTHYQLFRREWLLFGRVVWRKELFWEEIPVWVIIGLSTVGYYDSNAWRSKTPQWMHDAIKEK